MSNTVYIYQPHYQTQCFRVADYEQKGKDFNYVIVTCSPSHNGLWKYPVEVLKECSTWMNKSIRCYCVPISKCIKVKDLDELVNPNVIKEVKKQQNAWYKKEVKNRDYEYKKGKPEWML